MHADLRLHERVAPVGVLTPAQSFAAVVAMVGLVLAVFGPTTATMIEIWSRSETFVHGFLVLPAVVAFIWMRREALATLPLAPAATGLIAVAAAGALWLAGVLSSSLAPAQFGVIAVVPGAIAALFGWAWVRALAFPLAFLFFAVPFGEVFVPQLIEWTADVTIGAVAASGVPVYREGTSFVIPSGRWSVVEACSGIRYLIASVMLGSLYAWIVYRSPRRRALFIAASIAVPLVANWLRAYLIVMLGHLSNNRIAAGVDHLIYGWIFFGALMLVMFSIGARWREDRATVIRPPPVPTIPRGRVPIAMQIVLLALLTLALPLVEAALKRNVDARPVREVVVAPVQGWRVSVDAVLGSWRPEVSGAARTQVIAFTKDGQPVSVVLAIFRNQRQGREMVASSNQLVHPDNARWRVIARRAIELADAHGTFRSQAALIRGDGTQFAAAQWYWLGAARTTSDAMAKLDLALDRLLARGDTSAWVLVATPARDGLADGSAAIEAFVRDMGAALDSALGEMAAQ